MAYHVFSPMSRRAIAPFKAKFKFCLKFAWMIGRDCIHIAVILPCVGRDPSMSFVSFFKDIHNLKAGDTVYKAQFRGLDSPIPQNEIDQLRDVDGSVVRRVTRNFAWLDLRNGGLSKLHRVRICTHQMYGHPTIPCPWCGYGAG
jgi:hypothetical protein